MRRLLTLSLVGAWLALGGAAPAAAAGPTLTVFAAADLAFAFQELVPRFEKQAGARVSLVLGSSGNLATQIEHGAPADVFFAADRVFVERLAARGAVVPGTETVYAQGRVVLATAKSFGPKLTDLGALADPRVRHVAIANPLHAPYGRAAEEALRASGVWAAVKPKLVYGENIRHALQFIQTGAAEAGLVALSVANVPEVEWAPVDPRLYRPLEQTAAVVARSRHADLGVAFIKFVSGPEGRPIMKRQGF